MQFRKISFLSLLSLFLLPIIFSGCSTVAPRDTRIDPQPARAVRGKSGINSPPRSVSLRERFDRPFFTDDGAVEEEPLPEPDVTEAEEIENLQNIGAWEEGETVQTPRESEVEYDFPITMNRHVEFYIDFFQNKKPDMFRRWLARSGRYIPMIQEEFRQAGLPRDLTYLAMIESGFIETAYSRAKAAGMWQFIKSTARNYGLEVNNYEDERRDPVKATRAAAAYLSDLYGEFGSWYLAVAGYNAGEGKIRNAIARYNSTNFWELAKGNYLKLETKLYVPKLIAAIIIAKNPEKYGFDPIEYEEPLAYDIVEVPRWTSLNAVALACDEEVEALRILNRQLLRPFTPPDKAVYVLKVPLGKKDLALNNLDRVRAIVTTDFKTHLVARGDTLTSICNRYNLSKTILLKANPLRNGQLQIGQRLRIPYQTTTYELLPEGMANNDRLVSSAGDHFVLHKVRPGETISQIASRYGVPVHLIAGWNDIKDVNRIRAGSMLALYIRQAVGERASSSSAGLTIQPEKFKAPLMVAEAAEGSGHIEPKGFTPLYHTVQNGDSLWSIAREHHLSVNDIKLLNNLADSVIHPGERLRVNKEGSVAQTGLYETYYQVQGGDSLWTIAKKHHITPEEIKEWNNLKDDLIYPGNRLLLKVALDIGA